MARREHQMPNVLRQEGPRTYWYVRYRVKILVGKNRVKRQEKWHRVGYCDKMGKREAERVRDQIMQQVNREVYTLQSHMDFKDFVEIYREKHLPTVSSATQAKYGSLLNNHIIPYFAGQKLSAVDTENIQEFLNIQKEEGLSWWTRSDLKNILSSIFTQATDWRYWHDVNPTSRTKLGRKRWKRERRILTDDEFRRLLAALPALIQLMIMTAVSTGMRVSEVLGLKWRRVDLHRGCVVVVERYYRGDTDVPKSEHSNRDLPLGLLADVFRGYKPADAEKEGYVFQNGGEAFDDRVILKNFIRPAAEQLGLYFPGFGWHSFRRQNLTRIQDEGATRFDAQQQAGHSRPSMTDDYTIIDFERREKAVLRFQRKLLENPANGSTSTANAGIVREFETGECAKLLKDMVGPNGLEPLTSTVSR